MESFFTSAIWNNPHSSVVEKLFAGRASMIGNIVDDFGELLNRMGGNLNRTVINKKWSQIQFITPPLFANIQSNHL